MLHCWPGTVGLLETDKDCIDGIPFYIFFTGSILKWFCHYYHFFNFQVMNEKLNHCSELVELMRTTLTEKHSTRLEWMIIVLIAVEVRLGSSIIGMIFFQLIPEKYLLIGQKE